MSKAVYGYEIKDYAGRNCIIIVDEGKSEKTVTNDIENVVSEICRAENIEAHHFMIIYRDSEGMWDGWDPVVEEFVPLQQDTWGKAIRKYISKQLMA